MKPVKLSIAVLSVISLSALNGCAIYRDGHPMTQSGSIGENEKLFWTDRTWRQAKSQEWREEDRRLSRMRMQEFRD
ncbi:MAG: hypothetical protein AABM33_15605 [Pseudomonadota bacterium]